MRPAFMEVRPGLTASCKSRQYRVQQVIDLHKVLATDVKTGKPHVLPIRDLQPLQVKSAPETEGVAVGLDPYSEGWKEAQTKFRAIEPLLKNRYRTRADAEQAAKKAGVHVNTLYGWLRTFQDSGHVSSLIPQARGRRSGTRLLDPATEAVISSAIDEIYATRQRNTMQSVVERVMEVCRKTGVSAPHPNTVRNRIKQRAPAEMLRRRGRRDKARDLYEPILGAFPDADYPYHTVQVDHTQADIIVVDDETRQPLGRPWVTLAIDVTTRVVAGWYVSMESPGAAGTGICLTRAMLPKDHLLVELDVPGKWPVYGRIDSVHLDNAKEFRGIVMERACAEYGINLVMRPVKTPHYGGHIERLMGTMANQIRRLPGATFSSPAQRKGYNSEKMAALTLKEFETHLIDFIVNVYHQRAHEGINLPPIRKWEDGLLGDGDTPGRGFMTIPGDPQRLRLDFLPFVERSIQPYGIVIDRMHYFHEVLIPWINATDPQDVKRKRKFLIRRDPRDITRVHFMDPGSNEYYTIPCRNASRPAVSLWEWREACKRADEEGRDAVDEDSIFEALDRMRQRAEKAVQRTKSQRRILQRATAAKKQAIVKASSATAPDPAGSSIFDSTSAKATEESPDDIFAVPVEHFADERV